MKEKAFIYTHLGLGDMFMMNGAVRFLREKYQKVFVVSKPIYKETVRSMYQDDDGIVIVVADDADLHPWPLTSQRLVKDGFDVYGCGMFSMKPQKQIYDFPNSFYDDLDFPREIRKTHFRTPRTQAGQTLYESFQGRPYIVVHQEASTHTLPIVASLKARFLKMGQEPLIVDLNRNQVDRLKDPEGHQLVEKAIYRPFIEYAQLLEGAEEVHLVDSSIFCFAIHLDLSRVKKRVYYIRPGGHPIDNFNAFEMVADYTSM
jgi:hypothetical protein